MPSLTKTSCFSKHKSINNWYKIKFIQEWIIQWEERGLNTDFIIYYLEGGFIFKYKKVNVGSRCLWKVLKTFAVFWVTSMGEEVSSHHEVSCAAWSRNSKSMLESSFTRSSDDCDSNTSFVLCADDHAAYLCFWSWSCRPSDKGHIHWGFTRKQAQK